MAITITLSLEECLDVEEALQARHDDMQNEAHDLPTGSEQTEAKLRAEAFGDLEHKFGSSREAARGIA